VIRTPWFALVNACQRLVVTTTSLPLDQLVDEGAAKSSENTLVSVTGHVEPMHVPSERQTSFIVVALPSSQAPPTFCAIGAHMLVPLHA
jgi:hypothetical protein